jgi:DnaK suppressor protein
MDRRDLDFIRAKLVEELEELLSRKNCNLDGLNHAEEHLPDLIDRASSFIERSLSQNICDRGTLYISKIEQALEDIANGDYGICQQCGEDIAVKRLKANPVARYCIDCKTEMETRKQLTGG